MDVFLRHSEKRIFIEQIRLLLGNVGSSVLPAYLLASLMAMGLSRAENFRALLLWCLAVMGSKTLDALHARYFLKEARLHEGNVRSVYRQLLALHTLDAVAWASLALVTLSTASMVEFMLVNSVLAGIAGSSMSLLSPVLPVFITFIGVEFAIVAFKFWQLGDFSYHILTLALVLYFTSLSMQARNSCKAALAAIRLRFENTELLALLREETQKAVAAHQEAVQANLAKSKFLAAASHDLRQPIHALGLFLGVLGNSRLTEEQMQLLSSARSVTQASSEMLNTLLDFSRIDAGVVEVQVAPFRLQDLLFKLEKEFAPQANAKGLFYRSRDSQAILLSDVKLVELILRNLVSNAIRYTDTGGLLIACRRRGNQCCVEVWDTGIGIPQSQHQEIFREFHQLGNAERDRRKGLGLGLAIAGGLAARLGHALTLASVPGKGSVFRVTMDVAVQSCADLPAEGGGVQPTDLQGVSVLVLDDDEAVRKGMWQLLKDFGCRCIAVETLEEALWCARNDAPDLFISDHRLRGWQTGVQAIEQVRAQLGADLPALLITGDTDPERLRDAHASGVQLLHKPVAPAELQQAIARELSR
jgi:signal transduction histidine kinase